MEVCHICEKIVCQNPLEGESLYDLDFHCDCERYWAHKCKCGPHCDDHDIGHYDDSQCFFCYNSMPTDIKSDGYYNSKKRVAHTVQSWMKFAKTELKIPLDIAKKIGVFIIFQYEREMNIK